MRRLSKLFSGGRVAAIVVLTMGPTLGLATSTLAQGISPRTRDYLTRAQIDSALKVAQAGGHDKAAEAFGLQKRLTEGDFRQGDQIVFTLREPTSNGLPLPPDTLKVQAGKTVRIAVAGGKAMSLDGVLRSELKETIMKNLKPAIFKEPQFDVTPLVFLSVQGRVGRPGPFHVPADILLSDVIAQAIVAPDADQKKIEIRRGATSFVLWDAGAVQTALSDGLSVDDLQLADADEIFVPQVKGKISPTAVIQTTLGFLSLVFTIINLSRTARR